jgi:PhnB protein
MPAKPIPDGYYTATPYLIVDDAAGAIEFYKKAFGAQELMRFDVPGGKIGHAEIRIGNSPIMLADEFPGMGKSPKTLGGTPSSIMLYVADVDAMYNQAIAAGARQLQPVMDKFYGDRSGCLTDPFGHQWTVATHKEDLTLDQVKERMQAFNMKQSTGGAAAKS